MIQRQTMFKVSDNSGVLLAKCIHIYGGSTRKAGGIGDIVKVTARSVLPNGKIKKGEIFRGVVVRAAYNYVRKDGSFIRFGDNAIVLINDKGELIGTRVLGPVAREIKKAEEHSVNVRKILSLAQEVL